MPIGAIVFAEHWIFPLLKIEQYQAEKRGWTFNGAALGVCAILPIHLYFRWLPGWILAVLAYTGLMAWKGER
jgi:hypothetical protein